MSEQEKSVEKTYVYLVVRKTDRIIFGCFSTNEKAVKYADGSHGFDIQKLMVN